MEITNINVDEYINTLTSDRQTDIRTLVDIIKDITKKEPMLWGDIIGFGHLKYIYKTGHSGEMPIVGLASRKQAITLYLSYDINKYSILKTLGKYKTGKGCLYIKKLSDVDIETLKQLIDKAIEELKVQDFISELE